MSSRRYSEPIISAKDLRVQYGDREILHGINFDVNPMETIVILGGSGSGKSTLLRTLVGLEKPTSGAVWVRGTNLAQASQSELDDVRKKIGLAFQGGALIGSMTVGENVALPLREHTDLNSFHYRRDGAHQASAGGVVQIPALHAFTTQWRNEKARGARARHGDGS